MITEAEIDAKIRATLSKDFEIDVSTLKPETRLFEDLDFDSIDAVDLIVRLQQEIGKRVDPETFKTIRTYGDVVREVTALANAE